MSKEINAIWYSNFYTDEMISCHQECNIVIKEKYSGDEHKLKLYNKETTSQLAKRLRNFADQLEKIK